ncbi:hypothetical protein [Cypionkella sp.]|uniref:hypothetical protein n=1 Tax=Cypionkella sp. TaxID=2811411 RepID=UPI002722CDCA|nr:hypothetical protein [Cypionkella sp.]MDO8986369.1 hypothetical protein [Cypionkella sp.]MDP1577011.1 hypothetical protein [Cypionkella sp.]MDP2050026.1 hypothetical protein [Cypionkella sp.]
MNPHRLKPWLLARPLLLLLGLTALSGCAGAETGAVSPCHGQFRAEGKYFATRTLADGSQIVVSTMTAPPSDCAD